MANSDPGVLCFQHCSQRRVFCFQIPEYCPICRSNISSDSKLIPFRIPYPFVKASQYPCSIVIKPTNGEFLNDYKPSLDLHIGVTSSRGEIHEFDRCGLTRGSSDWRDCLLVHQVGREEEEETDWDNVLSQVAGMDTWTPNRYNEETFNCYTFVLAFLRCLKYPPLSDAAMDRTNFCDDFLTPRAEIAWKYIKLYRRLKDRGYYVSKLDGNDMSYE